MFMPADGYPLAPTLRGFRRCLEWQPGVFSSAAQPAGDSVSSENLEPIKVSEASTAKLQEPRLQDRRALLVAGLRQHYTSETVNDIPALWRRLPFGKIPTQLGHMAYGVLFNHSDDAGGFDYLAGVEVSGVSMALADLTYVKVPAQKYAIFCHRGHVSKLKDTAAAIWHEWLPASHRNVSHPAAGAPQMIEYYAENFDPETGLGDIEVWLPLDS
jgi:AraC family transcriptional regulator